MMPEDIQPFHTTEKQGLELVSDSRRMTFGCRITQTYPRSVDLQPSEDRWFEACRVVLGDVHTGTRQV